MSDDTGKLRQLAREAREVQRTIGYGTLLNALADAIDSLLDEARAKDQLWTKAKQILLDAKTVTDANTALARENLRLVEALKPVAELVPSDFQQQIELAIKHMMWLRDRARDALQEKIDAPKPK